MTGFQALFLALIQGLTEFLPISSSGHLVFFQKLFRLSSPPISFDIWLHFGTLGSILFFFRTEIKMLVQNWREHRKTWELLFWGSVPVAIFGYFFNRQIENVFDSLAVVGVAWILFGILLLSVWKTSRFQATKKSFLQTRWIDGIFIGFFQALALFPGISRSGSTITAGLWRRFSQEQAFEFSFLLAIPAILGAVVLELNEIVLGEISFFEDILAMLVAGIVGYFSLLFLQKALRSDKFYLFGFYCLAIGLVSLLVGFTL